MKTTTVDIGNPEIGLDPGETAKEKPQAKTTPIRLPFRVTALNEEAVTALNLNFKEIEYRLSVLQKYMKAKGYAAINESETAQAADTIVVVGLDANKPGGIVNRAGQWFYWATDTRKLYALLPLVIPASPLVSASIDSLVADLISINYVYPVVPSEHISASLSVTVSLLPA